MKSKIKYLFTACLLGSVICSCSDDNDFGSSVIPDAEKVTSETDIYIRDNYIVPYNITVTYKWNYSESDVSKMLVPPKEELVRPLMEVVSKAWIDPYLIADSKSDGRFIFRKYRPGQFFLVGSPAVNTDGTITQGTAEGGRKITLYQVNDFNRDNSEMFNRYFHVMHHEFAHILHQTTEFATEYQNISKGLYTPTWFNYSDAYANERGFITNYAMAEYHEDFVEMAAVMLTHTKAEWDKILADLPDSGRSIVKQKEVYVVDYFQNVWGINIYDMQAIISGKIQEILNEGNNGLKANDNALGFKPIYYKYQQTHHCQYCLEERSRTNTSNY